MWIDSHQHVWKLNRGDYDWLTPDLEPLYRDFDMIDYRTAVWSHAIAGSILVQAAATVDETEFLLSIAAKEDRVWGVVGWVDLESPDVVKKLEEFSSSAKFKGVRPMLQDMEERDWILNDAIHPALERLQTLDLTFDALILPDQLQIIDQLAQRTPQLRIVINHAAKPKIASNDLDAWAADLASVATNKNVFCKVSGFLTEAGSKRQTAQFVPVFDVLLSTFGTERLMWGTDWPFMLQADDLSVWLHLSDALSSQLSQKQRDDLFFKTATRFYGLNQLRRTS